MMRKFGMSLRSFFWSISNDKDFCAVPNVENTFMKKFRNRVDVYICACSRKYLRHLAYNIHVEHCPAALAPSASALFRTRSRCLVCLKEYEARMDFVWHLAIRHADRWLTD
jgi:hypothetical protein